MAVGGEPQQRNRDHSLDPAVYRPSSGQWFIRYSSLAYSTTQYGYLAWGASGDVPVALISTTTEGQTRRIPTVHGPVVRALLVDAVQPGGAWLRGMGREGRSAAPRRLRR